MHAAQHGGAFAHLQQRGSWPLIAHLQQQGSWPIGRWVALRLHAGHAQNARKAWGTIHFIPLLNACLQLDESEPLDIEGFAHEVVPWEPSQEAGGGYASESRIRCLSCIHQCFGADNVTDGRHMGAGHIRWRTAPLMTRRTIARLQQRELAADDAPHHCAPAAAGAGCRWRVAPLRACSSGGWPQMAWR